MALFTWPSRCSPSKTSLLGRQGDFGCPPQLDTSSVAKVFLLDGALKTVFSWVTRLLRVRGTCLEGGAGGGQGQGTTLQQPVPVRWAGVSTGGHSDLGRSTGKGHLAVSPGSPWLFLPTVLWPTDWRAVCAWPRHHHPAAPHALRRGTGEEFPAGVRWLGVAQRAGPWTSGQTTRGYLVRAELAAVSPASPGAGSPAQGDGSMRGNCGSLVHRLCHGRNRRVEPPPSQPPQRGVQDPLPAVRGPMWGMSVPRGWVSGPEK